MMLLLLLLLLLQACYPVPGLAWCEELAAETCTHT
jgi:hypothetical protein